MIKTDLHYKNGFCFLKKKMGFLEYKVSLEIVEQLPLCNARSLRGSRDPITQAKQGNPWSAR